VLGHEPGGDPDAALPDGFTRDVSPGARPVVLLAPSSADQVHEALQASGSHPVVVVLPNLARPALVLALLLGNGDDVEPPAARAVLARGTVDRLAHDAGRVRDDSGPQPAVEATGRPLDDLLTAIGTRSGGHDRPWAILTYPGTSAIESPATDGTARPFLSVLVRTQGRRHQALSDVLLCLVAQTCTDFEVLVLAHDLTAPDTQRLVAAVAGLPTTLRERVAVVPVEGGGRGRPLTVGTRLARGEYIALLDDDDLVLSHWVAAFRDTSAQHPGSIARSMVLEQDVDLSPAAPGFTAASWPRPRWDESWSLLAHIVDNHSPVHSYALPRTVFSELGLRYDESLPVLEDWDLLVRAAALVGVHDTGEVTGLYRRWPATSSSFAEVSEEDWPETAWRVVAGWDRDPLLLPAGSAVQLRRDGIYRLRHKPLRQLVAQRVDRSRDRWSGRLMRTPLGRPMRWIYRRARVDPGAES
jgi:glycosyltransferase involved in cell wall biosynthesis